MHRVENIYKDFIYDENTSFGIYLRDQTSKIIKIPRV